MVACAYLRVFQPLDLLPDPERGRWERFIADGRHATPPPPVYRQALSASRGRLGLLTVEDERADVRFVDGRWFVCPWHTRLRILASMLSLRETSPPEVADALVPEADAKRAARELARIRRRDPGAVPTLLQSPWHVPVRWFVLASEGERRLVERPAGGYRLFYWTALPDARERARRALEILRGADLDLVADLVADMVGWLEVFDERAVVELDYAEVADLFTWDELDEDHSARDVQEALDALEGGDPLRAGELYQTVAGRWAEARTRESLN